jgi:hypothetical protein
MANKFWGKTIQLVVMFTTLCFPFSYAQTTVCRNSRIYNFNNEYNLGETLCGETTSNASRLIVYFTVQDSFLYVHSNYITADYENPTKIATTETADLETILNTIYDDVDYDRLPSLIRKDITVYIDAKLINDVRHGNIDFSSVDKLNLYCPDGKVRPAIKIKKQDGKFELGIKYNNQIATKINDTNLSYIFTTIKEHKIDQKELKIISLFKVNLTKNKSALETGGSLVEFDFSNTDNFTKTLLANKDKRTVVVGNIEGVNLVKSDENGKTLFKISIEEIQKIQKANKQSIIVLGINSSKDGSAVSNNKNNLLDAVNRLANTVGTENIEDFLNSLSSETLHFILNQTIFPRLEDGFLAYKPAERLDFDIYSKSKGEVKTIQSSSTGKIIFLGTGISQYPDRAETTDSTTQTKSGNPKGDEDSESSTPLFVIIAIFSLFTALFTYKKFRKK